MFVTIVLVNRHNLLLSPFKRAPPLSLGRILWMASVTPFGWLMNAPKVAGIH